MDYTTEKISTDWLVRPTGDPFVDVGGLVIKYLKTQNDLKDRSVLGLIEYVAKIYVNDWGGKLNAFFLNSTITQPAFKGERKIKETLNYYKNLVEETANFKIGYCRILGEKTKLFSAGRDNHILSGSGTFINFHHSFESGIYLSKESIIRIFFAPLGLIQLSDKVALIFSNDLSVTEYFVVSNVANNLNNIGTGKTEGVLKSAFNNPANALFEFARDVISNIKNAVDNSRGVTLNLYHFTNFGASPTVDLYTLPATVFMFYAICVTSYELKEDWQKFVHAHYRSTKFKNGRFNAENDQWENTKENLSYLDYRSWRNIVYDKLLKDQFIFSDRQIQRWIKQHPFNFRIVELYQIHIRHMEKRTIDKIIELAEFIVADRSDDFIKRSITRLSGANVNHKVRRHLLQLVEHGYKEHREQPILTLEEYVEYLFPDGANWREIRDLLLIAIYQKMHEYKIYTDTTLEEAEEPNTENE